MDVKRNLTLLAIGGIDPTGGAGLCVDVRVAHAFGLHARVVPTCLTVQGRYGFERAEAVDAALLRSMLDVAWREGPVQAIKIGLCTELATVAVLADWLASSTHDEVPVVLDPVLFATAGGMRANAELVGALRTRLLPLTTVVTPNLDELEILGAGGGPLALLRLGALAVVVKGGHAAGAEVVDLLVWSGGQHAVRHERIGIGPVRGTGCAFATAFASTLALGKSHADALARASAFVTAGLRRTRPSADGLPVPLELPLSCPATA